jgi:hypothetical protein
MLSLVSWTPVATLPTVVNLLLGSTTPAVNLQLRIFRECLKKIEMMLLERF